MKKNKDKTINFLTGMIIGIVLMIALGAGSFLAYRYISSGVGLGRAKALAKAALVKTGLREGPPQRYGDNKKKSGGFFAGFKKSKDFYFSFERGDELNQLNAEEEVTIEVSDGHPTHGSHSLLVKIPTDGQFPGFSWEVFGGDAQDWSRAENFHFDVYNNTENSVSLEVKFKSGKNYPKKSYSYPVHLEPLANNSIEIPMSAIAQSCDLHAMSYVKIFAKHLKTNTFLYFDNMGMRQADGEDRISKGLESKNNELAKRESRKLERGYDVKIASSLDRVFKDGQTLVEPDFSPEAKISLAANEYEPFQIVVQNGMNQLIDVRVEITDLIHESLKTVLPRENITTRIVGYVPTKKPYYPVKYVGEWPDPLLEKQLLNIPPGEAQPFWITVYAEKDTKPGLYKGLIKVSVQGEDTKELPLFVRVYPFQLPTHSHLKTAFDFYAHETHTRYPQRATESYDQYQRRIGGLNEKFILEMLKYRMDPILNIDPTSDYELGRIDRYKPKGLSQFAIGRKGGTFNNNWPANATELEKLKPLYQRYGELLTLNKFIDSTYIYTWDEGEIGNPQVPKVTSMIHRAHPKLKNMVCYHGFWDPDDNTDWGKDIDIWCFQISNFDAKKMQKLKDYGMEMWMYVSGPSGDGTPNLAIDFDSVDYRIIPWMSWKLGFRGFLYWSVNWWVYVDPFKSAANTKWDQNGNGLLFYPGKKGPVPSLRAEIFRDGMEDYEYFVLLQKQLIEMRNLNLSEKHKGVFSKASKTLIIDKSIVKSERNFTKDGQKLKQYRDLMAAYIIEVGKILKEHKESLK